MTAARASFRTPRPGGLAGGKAGHRSSCSPVSGVCQPAHLPSPAPGILSPPVGLIIASPRAAPGNSGAQCEWDSRHMMRVSQGLRAAQFSPQLLARAMRHRIAIPRPFQDARLDPGRPIGDLIRGGPLQRPRPQGRRIPAVPSRQQQPGRQGRPLRRRHAGAGVARPAYLLRKMNVPFLLPTMTSGTLSPLRSQAATCVPTPELSSTITGVKVTPLALSRLTMNQ